jgi:hypothetical protein
VQLCAVVCIVQLCKVFLLKRLTKVVLELCFIKIVIRVHQDVMKREGGTVVSFIFLLRN